VSAVAAAVVVVDAAVVFFDLRLRRTKNVHLISFPEFSGLWVSVYF